MQHQICTEVEILYKLRHKHIIKLFSHSEDDKNIYLLLEYAENESLQKRLMINGPLTEEQTKKITIEIVDALDYMHNNAKIIHRDLKPENILFDK